MDFSHSGLSDFVLQPEIIVEELQILCDEEGSKSFGQEFKRLLSKTQGEVTSLAITMNHHERPYPMYPLDLIEKVTFTKLRKILLYVATSGDIWQFSPHTCPNLKEVDIMICAEELAKSVATFVHPGVQVLTARIKMPCSFSSEISIKLGFKVWIANMASQFPNVVDFNIMTCSLCQDCQMKYVDWALADICTSYPALKKLKIESRCKLTKIDNNGGLDHLPYYIFKELESLTLEWEVKVTEDFFQTLPRISKLKYLEFCWNQEIFVWEVAKYLGHLKEILVGPDRSLWFGHYEDWSIPVDLAKELPQVELILRYEDFV